MKKIAVAFCLFVAICAADEVSWRSNYEKGLQLISGGQYEQALSYLKMAMADKPVSQIIKEHDGDFEYLPYLQVGICYFHLGKQVLAGEYFELESNLQALSASIEGKKLWDKYQPGLDSPEETETEATIRKYKRQAYLLKDTEVARIKEEIRTRCNLPVAEEGAYPWYYHYELGLAMGKKKDWQRALDSFISALDHRDRPQKFSRIYGMWFLDYYPYYHIGMAHYYLGNWKCAVESFRLSRMMEDIPRGSADSIQLQQHQAEAEQNLGDSPN